MMSGGGVKTSVVGRELKASPKRLGERRAAEAPPRSADWRSWSGVVCGVFDGAGVVGSDGVAEGADGVFGVVGAVGVGVGVGTFGADGVGVGVGAGTSGL